ncbi:MAG: PEP/pyruvate-binding domain-containing protein, partial [Brevibacterium sp.]
MWEDQVASAMGSALDEVSVNCPDEETFERIQANALDVARSTSGGAATFARAFLDLQRESTTAAADAAPAAASPAVTVLRWVGLALMWLFAPVLGAAAFAGSRADGRNTVTFFRLLGGFAAVMVWVPVLIVAAFFWPLVIGIGIVSAVCGWLLLGLRRFRLCPDRPLTLRHLHPPATSQGALVTLTLGFTDPLATELATSGGKGASLAKSAQNLPVPGGFIVTAEAYTQFVTPLQSQITELMDTEHPAEAIGELIRSTPIPDSWLADFEAAAQTAGLRDEAVAVRSSGTMEDLPGAAFAGQHDTYLGVRGTHAIAEAVRDCYASLWNPHAFRYRQQLGVDQLEAKMAVVVQLMVAVGAEEAAGVAFSVDPVRGNTDEVLINAAFGLGETVVGGEEPVDEFRIARADGTQVAAEIANKPKALVMDGHGDARTREVHLGEDQQTRPALTAEQARAVAELSVRAEDHFGFPQDIEWAFSGDDLFLLQSRPITRVAPRWTRDESAERFPTPVTPLTWDLVEAGFHYSLNHSFDLMGLPPFDDKWFVMRDFYIYGNQTAVDLYAGRLPTKMLSSVETITESLPEIASQFGWVQELPVRWMRDLDTYLMGIGKLSHEPLEEKSLAEVWDHVIAISDLG